MNKKVVSIIAIILIVSALGVVLVACNASSYQKKLEKAGYKVSVLERDKDDGVTCIWKVTGMKVDGLSKIETVTITKYAEKAESEEAERTAIELVGEDCVSRSGKIVIVASSKQALKDAK